MSLWEGIQLQLNAFLFGFGTLVPATAGFLQFTPTECFESLFGKSEVDPEHWSLHHLRACILPDHGYSADSQQFTDFLEILSEFSDTERPRFVQFCTGTPILPAGGFAGLRPLMKIVKKSGEDSSAVDSILPSVMTCSNYLKLPAYSSKEVMRRQIRLATEEGCGAFMLS
eukprot:Polyplicarium_translucidae@DN3114_c0_g1_i2.p2